MDKKDLFLIVNQIKPLPNGFFQLYYDDIENINIDYKQQTITIDFFHEYSDMLNFNDIDMSTLKIYHNKNSITDES